MEDLSLHLKKCFEDLYKKKPETASSLRNRVSMMNESRKTHRLDAALRNRNIPENLSPCPSPLPKIPKVSKKEEKPPNKRLEMLAKWKAEKEKQKLDEKRRNKPVFKVSKVSKEVGLPNLENVNREIKGKQFKSKFAPANHKFKPPANIKPIQFTNQPEPRRIMTRSQTQKVQNVIDRSKKTITKPSTPKSSTQTNTKKTPKLKEQFKNETVAVVANEKNMQKEKNSSNNNKAVTGNEKENNNKSLKINLKKTPMKQEQPKYVIPVITLSRDEENARKEYHAHKSRICKSSGCTSPESKPNNRVDEKTILEEKEPSSDKSLKINEKTPDKQGPPKYVSPFITLSRGKDNARKEYHAKKSGNWKYSDCTSPKAGAAYFSWCLDNQISRLKGLCNKWDNYKINENPPEEAISMIDVAIGQTNLLISKKFEQFRGLIDRCQNGDGDTPVTLEDLHGFWDMIFIQVKNLDIRFENLDKLKMNNWEEIVPEIKKQTTKKKGKASKTAKASEGLRAAILAARRRKQETESVQKTPSKRKSLVNNVMSGQTKGSPGLMMMKVAQYAKGVETPSKSILKDREKSAKSQKKTVLFQDKFESENNLNIANLDAKAKTPTRRSVRLNGTKLF